MDIDHPYWKVSRSPPYHRFDRGDTSASKRIHKQWEFHRWASWWWNQRWIKDWIWGWFVSSRAIAAGLLYRVLPNHDSWGTILFRRCKSDTWAREKAQNDTTTLEETPSTVTRLVIGTTRLLVVKVSKRVSLGWHISFCYCHDRSFRGFCLCLFILVYWSHHHLYNCFYSVTGWFHSP